MAKKKYRYTTIGKNIRKFREARGLTQRQLAHQLHINPTAVSAWEIGRTRPGIDSAEALTQLLGIQIDDLYEGVPDTERKRQLHFKNQRYRPQLDGGLVSRDGQEKFDDIDKALRIVMSYHGRAVTEKDRFVLAKIIRGYLDGQD